MLKRYWLATAVLFFLSGCSRSDLWDAAGQPFDGIPPAITYTSVTDNQSGVLVDASFEVKFDSELDSASAVSGVQLTVSNGVPVGASINYTSSRIKIIPTARLIRGASYVLTVSTNVQDLFGNRLAAQSVIRFQTAPGLQLKYLSRSGGSVDLLADGVQLTFNEPVDTGRSWAVAVSGQSTVQLKPDSAGVSWNSAKTVLSFPLNIYWTAVTNSGKDKISVDLSNFAAAVDGAPLQQSNKQMDLPYSWTNAASFSAGSGTNRTPLLLAGENRLWLFYADNNGKISAASGSGGSWSTVAGPSRADGSPFSGAVYGDAGWIAAVTASNRLTVCSASNGTPIPGSQALPQTGVLDLALAAPAADRLCLAWITTNTPNRIQISVWSNDTWTEVTNIAADGEDWQGLTMAAADGKAVAAAWKKSPGTGLTLIDCNDFSRSTLFSGTEVIRAGLDFSAADQGVALVESTALVSTRLYDGSVWSDKADLSLAAGQGGLSGVFSTAEGPYCLLRNSGRLHLYRYVDLPGGWTALSWAAVDDSSDVSDASAVQWDNRVWAAYYRNGSAVVSVH